MSHIDPSLLARYNSLMDPHLASYFQNPKMRRQLRKNGLITRNGEIISENSYRQMMARKEHQRHVRELLAQAIVHKTLDMERTRQVQIKKKLEEITKIELVRRVKGEPSTWEEMIKELQQKRPKKKKRGPYRNNSAQTAPVSDAASGDSERKGDEDILPYLSPRRSMSRPSSVPAGKTGRPRKQRPVSAPSQGNKSGQWEMSPIVTDEHGVPVTPRDSLPEEGRAGKGKRKKYPIEIDDKHLYSLDSQALRDYTMTMNQSPVGPSPYLNNQIGFEIVPVPPSARPSARRRIQHTDRLGRPIRVKKGGPPLHRAEPAMRHPERIQTMCHITLHYFGSHLKLDYERLDPRDEVVVEQQHCGGNTLTVFKEKLLPKCDFTFVSRRHRGYPFSLTIYIEGKVDCRLSTCCEYKHSKGSRLGGPQGHFGVVYIDGAAPCYRCQVNEQLKSLDEKKRLKAQKAAEKEAKDQEEADTKDNAENESEKYSDDEDHEEDPASDAEPESPRDTARETPVQIKGYADDDDEHTDESDSDDDIDEEIPEEEDGEVQSLPWKTGTVPEEKDEGMNEPNKKQDDYSNSDFEDEGTPKEKKSPEKPMIGHASHVAPRDSSRSPSTSSSRSNSSSRSSSRSKSSSSSRSSSGERTKKDKVQATQPAGALTKEAAAESEDEFKTPPQTAKSNSSHSSGSSSGSSTDRSSASDTDRGIDSDRKKPPESVIDNSNNANNSDLDRTREDPAAEAQKQSLEEEKRKEEEKKEDKPEVIIVKEPPYIPEVVSKSMAPMGHSESEDSADEDKQNSTEENGQDTLRASGQGGDDTLKALADEMEKVLETEQKEESPVEKTASSDSSSDTFSSSDSDSGTELEASTQKIHNAEPNYQTTDQDTSDYAGGADPDDVANDSSKPATHLTQIGVTPGPRHDGSIRPLVEGKRDIELTSLSLSEDQVAELSTVLKDSPDVESLVLRNSGITNAGMKELNKGLTTAKKIKMVNLNCNKLTEADQISELLLYPKAVEILLLHGNPLGDVGIKELTASLISIHRSAASDEEMVEVRRKAKDLVADVMYDALHSSSLESIVTQGSTSTNNGSIAKLLAESERLTTGNLSGLALKQLDLGDCGMTSEGASCIAEMIVHNMPIENLSLTGNKGVDIIGWDAVAEALKVNNKITTLSLDYNNLGDGGASVIAEALCENKAIRSIDLEGNKIGEQGGRKLLEAVSKSQNIRDITLMPGNNIPESLLAQIKDELSGRGAQK